MGQSSSHGVLPITVAAYPPDQNIAILPKSIFEVLTSAIRSLKREPRLVPMDAES